MASLYNKYRPSTWDSVVDQDDVVIPIRRQIIERKTSHAYLLVGTRGTGKTTTAKILGKAVNCLSLHEGSPCGTCESCTSNSLDFIEMDAASNNGVANIRNINESVLYPPVTLKHKVYIIDEVHMLSKGAFDALLKTLEEPPDYCIFILCTTEINKVPATIRSRCQKYDFKRISQKAMEDRMSIILKEEGYSYEQEALSLIASNADGALRDCLSMLEQACFVAEGTITEQVVAKMIGCTDKTALLKFCTAILEEEVGVSLKFLQHFVENGKEMKILADETLQAFRDIMVVQSAPDYPLESTKEYRESIQGMTKKYPPGKVIFLVSRMNKLLQKVSQSVNTVITFEQELLMIFHGVGEIPEETVVHLRSRIEKLESLIKKLSNGERFCSPANTAQLEDARINTVLQDKDEELSWGAYGSFAGERQIESDEHEVLTYMSEPVFEVSHIREMVESLLASFMSTLPDYEEKLMKLCNELSNFLDRYMKNDVVSDNGHGLLRKGVASILSTMAVPMGISIRIQNTLIEELERSAGQLPDTCGVKDTVESPDFTANSREGRIEKPTNIEIVQSEAVSCIERDFIESRCKEDSIFDLFISKSKVQYLQDGVLIVTIKPFISAFKELYQELFDAAGIMVEVKE